MSKDELLQLDKKQINPPKKEPMPWEEFYQLSRQHMVELHNIINQRTIWLAISQSFFFGGYAGVANAPKEAKNPIFGGQQDLLLWLIPGAALVACLCIFVGLIGRDMCIRNLQKKFDQYQPVNVNYPPLDAPDIVRAMEKFALWTLPMVFIITWGFILVKQFMQV